MKNKYLLITSGLALALAGSSHAVTLLTDNFNSGSYGASTFNSTLAADQGGTLTTVSYTVGGYSEDWQVQHGNTATAFLIGDSAGPYASFMSLNRDFADDAISYNGAITIQFDANTVSGSWVSFGIGSVQGALEGASPAGETISSGGTSKTYKFVLSDTTGALSAFNGITNGAKVEFYENNALQSTTFTTLNNGDGFLTWRANQGAPFNIAKIDNLAISVIPEPGAALLGGLGMLCLLRRRR